MPIYKAKISNLTVDLNYEEKDKQRLIKLIEVLNNRLEKYKKLNGKISDSKILILVSLELEDKLNDLSLKINKNNIFEENFKNAKKQVKELTSQLVLIKDKINNVTKQNNLKNNNNEILIELIKEINSEVNQIKDQIINSYD